MWVPCLTANRRLEKSVNLPVYPNVFERFSFCLAVRYETSHRKFLNCQLSSPQRRHNVGIKCNLVPLDAGSRNEIQLNAIFYHFGAGASLCPY